MYQIPDLKKDYTFLKKIESHHKAWNDFEAEKPKRVTERRSSHFSSHPKRLSSDSECSSKINSPRKFFSGTIVKDDTNNNFQETLLAKLNEIRRSNEEIPFETQIGDSVKAKCEVFPNESMTTIVKKIKKPRASSTRIVDNYDKKFGGMVEKSLKLLNEIRGTLEKGVPPADGEEDFNRRSKRMQEFSSRFSRVYLYPLVRQMNELSIPEKMTTAMINQKITYAQQIILQGLQAYHTHLPSSLGNCCSDKLKSLLEQVIYLCQIHELVKKSEPHRDSNEYINALRTHSELLMETINTFDLRFVEKKSKPNETNTQIKKKKVVKPPNKLNSKLSMYCMTASFRKDAEWKRAVQNLAKKKFNVKSRYKTANFKHRPPVEKPHIVSLPSKLKLFPKMSSGIIKSTPIRSPVKEEDIETMVGINILAPSNSAVIDTQELVNHGSGTAPEKEELVRDSDRKNDENEDVKKALEVLRKCLTDEDKNEVLDKIASEVEKKKRERIKKKEPVITVTGPKNARLICIQDNNSLIEDNPGERIDKEIMTDKEIKLTSSETQTEFKDATKEPAITKSTNKISRLPKSSHKLLKILPKHYAIKIIQYKLLYHNYCKPNPMYKKSSSVQPWALMGRVSDEILDQILLSVTEELEPKEILENLYNAEFQY